MFQAMTHTNIWVTDQDEALDFYVGKLGLEVAADQDLGFMRWLTVNVPGQPDRQIILSALQPPAVEPALLEPARQLLGAGVTGMVFLTTADCRATHAQLSGSGVEFSQGPIEQPYGLDCEARDPFGNRVRIAETAAGA